MFLNHAHIIKTGKQGLFSSLIKCGEFSRTVTRVPFRGTFNSFQYANGEINIEKIMAGKPKGKGGIVHNTQKFTDNGTFENRASNGFPYQCNYFEMSVVFS